MENSWKDITSYSRNDRERVPQTWELRAGSLRLIVTRHIDYPGKWSATCSGLGSSWRHVLKSKDIEAAKAEAVALVRETIADMAAAWAERTGSKN